MEGQKIIRFQTSWTYLQASQNRRQHAHYMQQNLAVTRLQVLFFFLKFMGNYVFLGFSLHLVAVGKKRQG